MPENFFDMQTAIIWTLIAGLFYVSVLVIQKIVFKKKGIQMPKKETKKTIEEVEKDDYNENI